MQEKQTGGKEILLGIDYGKSHIGVAFGRNGLVQPIKVLQKANESTAIHEITRLAIENRVKTIVVGLPLTVDGAETLQSQAVRKFARLLRTFSKKQIFFQNEYGTTAEAAEASLNQNISLGKRRFKDHLAAAIILKKYFSAFREQVP